MLPPMPTWNPEWASGFYRVPSANLQGETVTKGVTDVADLTPIQPGLYLWQGDITTLKCDAIVNAANSGMTGCYMVKRQENMKIPTELLPTCPHCGKPLTMNLRSDNKFVEDEGWHRAAERYENFLRTRAGQKILFLEFGVGYNTPVIIKYPFWQMTAKNPKAIYACINQGQAVCPQEIERQSVCINADIGQVLQSLSDAAIQ